MDRIPAESVRLEEAENTAELLSGETGERFLPEAESKKIPRREIREKICLLFFLPFLTATACLMLFGRAAGVFHGVAVLCAVWMVNESFKLSGDWFCSCSGVLRIPSSDELGVSYSRTRYGLYGVVCSCVPFITVPGMAGSGGMGVSCFGASPPGAASGRTAS